MFITPSGNTQVRAKNDKQEEPSLPLGLHSTPVSHLVVWVQLQSHSLASNTSAGKISFKTFGNLFPETMTNTTSAWIAAHVYLYCVQLVGTSLSCAFLSLCGLRVLYSRCTCTASCHSSLLMSWTNCSLGSIFSSPDLCGFLHPLQFLVFLNKAYVPRLEMGFCCPAPSKGKWDLSFH